MLPSSCNTRFLKRISRSVRLLPTNRDTWIYNVAQRSEGAKCTSGEQRWHQRHTTASHQGGGLHRGDQMRTPGVEPGSQAWEACMIPLHYVRCYSLIFNGGNLKCRIAKGADLQYCMDQIHGCHANSHFESGCASTIIVEPSAAIAHEQSCCQCIALRASQRRMRSAIA